LIQEALAEISDEEYDTNFNTLAEKHWNSIKEQNSQKKRKKFVDYLLYRGYESFLVFDKLDELEKRKIE
jgi:regulatory protein